MVEFTGMIPQGSILDRPVYHAGWREQKLLMTPFRKKALTISGNDPKIIKAIAQAIFSHETLIFKVIRSNQNGSQRTKKSH